MSIETLYTAYLFGALLLAIIAVALAVVMSRANDTQDDEELAESLRRDSEAKLAQKSVPIMLRKQCD
jgi:TRAP-type C4-dicarboxylate transport system permease large subunit